MKKLLSKLFIVSTIIGILFFATVNKSSAAETQPDCPYITFTCPDGTTAYGMVCDAEDLAFILNYFCNIKIQTDTD